MAKRLNDYVLGVSPLSAGVIALVTALLTLLGYVLRGYSILFSIVCALAFALLAVNAWIDSHTMKLVPLWSNVAAVLWCVAGVERVYIGQWQEALMAGGAGLLMFVLFRLVSAINPQAFGAGDARLIGVCSAWVSFAGTNWLFVFAMLAVLIQLGAFGIRWIVTRRSEDTQKVLPFGPALVAGAWLTCCVAPYVALGVGV